MKRSSVAFYFGVLVFFLIWLNCVVAVFKQQIRKQILSKKSFKSVCFQIRLQQVVGGEIHNFKDFFRDLIMSNNRSPYMGSFKQGRTYFFSVSSLNITVVLRQLCLVHQIREGTIKYKGALELTLLALKMFANTCWRRNICSLEVCARAWSF